MPHTDLISTLPQPEQKALAVCGVYKAEQLCRLQLSTFLAEMAQAAELFPDTFAGITKERLRDIYLQAITINTRQAPPENDDATLPAEAEAPPMQEAGDGTRPLPQLVEKQRVKVRKIAPASSTEEGQINLSKLPRESGAPGRGKSIRNTRPFRTYFSSLICLWMVASCFYLLFTGIKAMLQFEAPGKLELILPMGSFFLSVCAFLVYATKTTCPVCNMKLYSIHRYSRNHHAHHLPLIGYTGATALHILFRFWFRCPACGTPQRLNKRKS